MEDINQNAENNRLDTYEDILIKVIENRIISKNIPTFEDKINLLSNLPDKIKSVFQPIETGLEELRNNKSFSEGCEILLKGWNLLENKSEYTDSQYNEIRALKKGINKIWDF